MRARRLAALVMAVLLLASPAFAAGDDDPELESLRQLHFCEILAYLKGIRHAPAKLPHRYLTVEVDQVTAYVQCLFYSRNRRILCEVASGFYQKPRANYVTAERMPALAALGYSLDDSKGNFQQRRAISGDATLSDVADLIIRSLREAYGVTATAQFRYHAPLVEVAPPARSYSGGKCGALTS
jgi:hypothetical protein